VVIDVTAMKTLVKPMKGSFAVEICDFLHNQRWWTECEQRQITNQVQVSSDGEPSADEDELPKNCELLVLRKMKMATWDFPLERNHVQNKQDFKSQNNKILKISNEI
jgi:hypothetical protein